MKTMLIPVDFTETSGNAVMYAIHWAKRYSYERIIVLKTFYDSLFENLVISAEYARVNQDYQSEERTAAADKMKALTDSMLSSVGTEIEVVPVLSELPLLRAVVGLIENEAPEIIVMGSDTSEYSSGSFIAGNLIGIAKASSVKVLIVPASYEYREVHAALVPLDFDLVDNLDKLEVMRRSHAFSDVRIHVLNIDPKERYLQRNQKFIDQENALHHYLTHFKHDLYYDSQKDIITGIFNFSQSHPVDLIIALPGNRSFLYALTHKSISQALWRNTQLPVLILK